MVLLQAVPWFGFIGHSDHRLQAAAGGASCSSKDTHEDTHAISFATNIMFGVGLVFWSVYGTAIVDWPLIGSNVMSMIFTAVIIGMKHRHG